MTNNYVAEQKECVAFLFRGWPGSHTWNMGLFRRDAVIRRNQLARSKVQDFCLSKLNRAPCHFLLFITWALLCQPQRLWIYHGHSFYPISCFVRLNRFIKQAACLSFFFTSPTKYFVITHLHPIRGTWWAHFSSTSAFTSHVTHGLSKKSHQRPQVSCVELLKRNWNVALLCVIC